MSLNARQLQLDRAQASLAMRQLDLDYAQAEPKTAAALFARVLPYFINVNEVPEVASEAEIEAQFKELGLPLGLIEHLQIAPAPLDPGEDPDPYGLMKDQRSRGFSHIILI
jgi:hypothetical protein